MEKSGISCLVGVGSTESKVLKINPKRTRAYGYWRASPGWIKVRSAAKGATWAGLIGYTGLAGLAFGLPVSEWLDGVLCWVSGWGLEGSTNGSWSLFALLALPVLGFVEGGVQCPSCRMAHLRVVRPIRSADDASKLTELTLKFKWIRKCPSSLRFHIYDEDHGLSFTPDKRT